MEAGERGCSTTFISRKINQTLLFIIWPLALATPRNLMRVCLVFISKRSIQISFAPGSELFSTLVHSIKYANFSFHRFLSAVLAGCLLANRYCNIGRHSITQT